MPLLLVPPSSQLYASGRGSLRSAPSALSSSPATASASASASVATRDVELKSFESLGPVVMYHGLGNSRERMDSFAFENLNSKDHPVFQGRFTKIVAFVDDVKFSKKRLIGRSARYSGLLDVLEFRSGEDEGGKGSVPTPDQMGDVDALLSFGPEEGEVKSLIKVRSWRCQKNLQF